MSSPVYVAEGESECDGVADDGGVGFLRTGRSQAGEGRPVPSGTRGESTGMLQTEWRQDTRTYLVGRGVMLILTATELVDDIR